MGTRVRSLKEAQHRHARELRQQGMTWVEVAGVFQKHYRVNARVAYRLARGWSQRDAADRWNERWPDDPKTFKNFSYWEQWPNRTGYAPSLEVLGRLAELYACGVADLVSDCLAFHNLDEAYRSRTELANSPVQLRLPKVLILPNRVPPKI